MRPVLLGLCLCLPAARGVPFEKAARDFMARHGLADRKAEEVDFDSVLREHYLRGRLGAFEVHFPVAGLEKRASDFKECAAALLLAQEKLCDWHKPAAEDQKSLRADLKALGDWVKGWRLPALAHAKDCAGKDVAEVLSAPEPVAAAAGRLADVLGKGGAVGLAREAPASIRMLLLPTRKEFVELACFVGATNEDDKATYWVDAVADWGSCWVQDVQAIALEYAPTGHAADDYTSGSGMNERDPTVMQQQVVQFAFQRFFGELYGEATPAAFVGGLSMNLVVDSFGEISTRLDGDLRGRRTAGRSVFVPGVRGDGFLAKNSAETRWREDHGRDRFVKPLRMAQKEGEDLAKTIKNRAAVFGVRSDAGGEIFPVHAPFFCASAPATEDVDPKFQGDAAELRRAYPCAFVAWLRGKALATEKGSHEKFAALLEKLGNPETTFEAVFPSVYDAQALSDAEAGKDTLEGKFLIWLSRSK